MFVLTLNYTYRVKDRAHTHCLYLYLLCWMLESTPTPIHSNSYSDNDLTNPLLDVEALTGPCAEGEGCYEVCKVASTYCHFPLPMIPFLPMKVLIACEMSGRVRDAFTARGHYAVSCDLAESLSPGPHYRCDALKIINSSWDLMIAHPPCTDLAVSGARWFEEKRADGRQQRALEFVQALLDAPIAKIALENPVSVISTYIRKPDQIIQPWQFGHGERKATCLWLKNLPKLHPTNVVGGREQKVWRMGPSPDRAMLRSLTYQGIADAMAEQWGGDV